MATQFSKKDITIPKSGLTVVTDHYWLCENGDPTKALFYGESRQCNKDKRIPEHLLKNNSLYKDLNLSVVFVPIAYVPEHKY